MAMGTPLYALLFHTLPPTRAFTPVRILCLFAFSAVTLASIGLDAFQENKEKTGWIPWAGFTIITLATAFIGFVIYNVQNQTPWFNNMLTYYLKCGVIELPNNFADRSVFATQMLARIGTFYRWENLQLTAPLLLGLIGAAILFLKRAGKITRNIFIVSVFVIILLDLFPIGQRYNPAFPKNSIYPQAAAIKLLKRDKGIHRICGWKRYPHPNTLTAYDISEINGYSSMYPSRVRDLFYAINGGSLPSPILCVMENGKFLNRGLAKLMGIKYFYNNPGGEPPPLIPTQEIYRKDLSIFLNLDEIKRAFIVKDYEVNSPGEILKKMLSPDFDPQKVVYLEEKPDVTGDLLPFRSPHIRSPHIRSPHNLGSGGSPDPPENGIKSRHGNLSDKRSQDTYGDSNKNSVNITLYSPHKVEMDVNSSTDGFLVLTDTFYPGWKAFVDNKPVKIYRADFFARAIPVRAGVHKVVFDFKPDSLRIGLYITIASGLILLAMVLLGIFHHEATEDTKKKKDNGNGIRNHKIIPN
ncbi:MAG: YfhO family protein [Candidatus Eremiobacteraeota bacterium]|nr:YfhO family protein [Candidatus Eremiobacteraeota bacterium]